MSANNMLSRRWVPAVVAVVAMSSLTSSARADKDEEDSNEFREDVIACEEATLHAVACCPGLEPPKRACRHYHRYLSRRCHDGCSASRSSGYKSDWWPVLSLAESDDITSQTCAELQRGDGCADLAALLARSHWSPLVDWSCGPDDY